MMKETRQELFRNTSSRLESIRAVNFAIAKEQDRTSRMEDYLGVIYELIQDKGYATNTDIADYLKVSLPSVTKMLRKLNKTSWVDYEKYRRIRLTKEGIAVAKSIHERRSLMTEFFRLIGVDEATANEDAEGVEHHLHRETLEKLQKFVEIIKTTKASL